MKINGREVMVAKVPEDEGGGYEAYLNGARWTYNGCGETEKEALKDLVLCCMDMGKKNEVSNRR